MAHPVPNPTGSNTLFSSSWNSQLPAADLHHKYPVHKDYYNRIMGIKDSIKLQRRTKHTFIPIICMAENVRNTHEKRNPKIQCNRRQTQIFLLIMRS